MITFSEQDFLTKFPEFTTCTLGQISQASGAAQLEMGECEWGELGPEGLLWLTAHKLASTPFGQTTRLQDDERKNTYLIEFKRIERLRRIPWLVT